MFDVQGITSENECDEFGKRSWAELIQLQSFPIDTEKRGQRKKKTAEQLHGRKVHFSSKDSLTILLVEGLFLPVSLFSSHKPNKVAAYANVSHLYQSENWPFHAKKMTIGITDPSLLINKQFTCMVIQFTKVKKIRRILIWRKWWKLEEVGRENPEFYFICVNMGIRKPQKSTLEKKWNCFKLSSQNQNLSDWVEYKIKIYAVFIINKQIQMTLKN